MNNLFNQTTRMLDQEQIQLVDQTTVKRKKQQLLATITVLGSNSSYQIISHNFVKRGLIIDSPY